jgi:hypothetical protein
MADWLAIYSDVATRHVKVFEVQKEHSIFGSSFQAHTWGNLRPYWSWAPQCIPVVGRNKARTRDGNLDQGCSRSALTHQVWCGRDEVNPSRASLQLAWAKSISGGRCQGDKAECEDRDENGIGTSPKPWARAEPHRYAN